MPNTLTIKNIPDDLYIRLQASAEIHHRSLDNEAIVCLEERLFTTRISTNERIFRARQLRNIPQGEFKEADIAKAIAHEYTTYDCEFVVLARYLDTKMVTMDKKIIYNFPEIAVSLFEWK